MTPYSPLFSSSATRRQVKFNFSCHNVKNPQSRFSSNKHIRYFLCNLTKFIDYKILYSRNTIDLYSTCTRYCHVRLFASGCVTKRNACKAEIRLHARQHTPGSSCESQGRARRRNRPLQTIGQMHVFAVKQHSTCSVHRLGTGSSLTLCHDASCLQFHPARYTYATAVHLIQITRLVIHIIGSQHFANRIPLLHKRPHI